MDVDRIGRQAQAQVGHGRAGAPGRSHPGREPDDQLAVDAGRRAPAGLLAAARRQSDDQFAALTGGRPSDAVPASAGRQPDVSAPAVPAEAGRSSNATSERISSAGGGRDAFVFAPRTGYPVPTFLNARLRIFAKDIPGLLPEGIAVDLRHVNELA